MYICTTTPKVASPSCFHSRDRCSAVTAATSALNRSAKSTTAASASDSGSPTWTLEGKGGSDIVCAHTRRTSAATRPSPGHNDTSRVSWSSRTETGAAIRHTLERVLPGGNRLLSLAHRGHVEVRYPQRRHRGAGGPITPFARQRLFADAG